MYVNKCTKCGSEFETKNPKRVICPDCLYPDKKMALSSDSASENDTEREEKNPKQEQHSEQQSSNQQQDSEHPPQQKFYNSYSQDAPQQRFYSTPDNRGYNQDRGGYQRPQGGGGYNRPQQGGYNRPQGGGGYNRPQQGGYQRPQGGGGYNRPQQGGYQRPQGGGGYNRPQQGGYQRPQGGGGYNRPQQGGGGYQQRQGGYNRPQQGGYQRPQGGRFNKGAPRPQNRNKPLLVNKEQLEQIEVLYKTMLPLPNPDAHEVIGEKIGLEPRKVFFGINLIRQKMMLPKLPFPKRKLAISPDQMFAIQNLYEPLLPLPPIGCHKIIAAQLKMDEWRVHVGIGLIRAKLGLDRWNQEREDAPAELKQAKESEKAKEKKPKKAKEPKEPKEAKEEKEKGKKKKSSKESGE